MRLRRSAHFGRRCSTNSPRGNSVSAVGKSSLAACGWLASDLARPGVTAMRLTRDRCPPARRNHQALVIAAKPNQTNHPQPGPSPSSPARRAFGSHLTDLFVQPQGCGHDNLVTSSVANIEHLANRTPFYTAGRRVPVRRASELRVALRVAGESDRLRSLPIRTLSQLAQHQNMAWRRRAPAC